jgi:positive regulator of sigma E activity
VYEQLGNVKGPSVAWKAVVAFILPLAIFITGMAAFQKILAQPLPDEKGRTILSFLLAMAATIGFVSIVKFVNKRLAKKRES